MNYIDYLTTHEYDELPAEARAKIGREEYTERRGIALAAGPAKVGLPPALAAAFSEATRGAGPQVRGTVVKSGGRRPWLLAAAGWLLFATMATVFFLRGPKEKLVYEQLPAPPAEVIVERDTVYRVETETVVRYRTVRDTVLVVVPKPTFVTVKDTVFLPQRQPVATPVSGSRSLAERRGVTRFLSGAE